MLLRIAIGTSGGFIQACAPYGTCGIAAEEQAAVLRLVAAVLHCGQLGFVADAGSLADGSHLDDASRAAALPAAAALLGVVPEALEEAQLQGVTAAAAS